MAAYCSLVGTFVLADVSLRGVSLSETLLLAGAFLRGTLLLSDGGIVQFKLNSPFAKKVRRRTAHRC
jgi:hypothetical protein